MRRKKEERRYHSAMESEDISFSDVVPHEYPNDAEDPAPESVNEREEDEGAQEENNVDEESVDANQDQDAPHDGELEANNDELDDAQYAVDQITESSPLKKVRRFKSEIKKVASKWLLFSGEVRPQVMAEFPEYGFSEVAKAVAERYRNISAEDSERLDLLVSADKERYRAEMAEAEEDAPVTGGLQAGDELIMHPSVGLSFPLSKVRKACRLDPEVKAISKDAVPLITKAAELFVGFLARKCAYTVSLRGVRSIREQDVIQTIFMHEALEFLRIDFPRKSVPALVKAGGKPDPATTPKHRVVSSGDGAREIGGKNKAGRGAAEEVTTVGKSIASFFGGEQPKKRSMEVEDEVVEEVQQGDDEEVDEGVEEGKDTEAGEQEELDEGVVASAADE